MKRNLLFFCLLFISLLHGADEVLLKNEKVSFSFDSATGALREIVFQNTTIPVKSNSCALIEKSDKIIFATPGKTFQLKEQQISGSELRQIFTAPGWELEVTNKLFPESTVLARKCRWKNTGDKLVPVKMIKMILTTGAVGDPKSCFVTHPCSFPTEDISLSRPKVSWKYSGGEHMPGCVLYQPALKLGLSYTMHSFSSDFAIISGSGKNQATFTSNYNIRTPLKPGESCESGTELISLGTGTLGDVSATLHKAWEKNGFRLKQRPEWTCGAVIYSAHVQGTHASFYRDLGTLEIFRKAVLPHLQKMGIDILWLNPFNLGGYSLYSFDINPAVGNKADLKRLTEDAKKRGMRVLMDLVIHGPSPRSKTLGPWIVKNHPDWISRDKDGKFKFWWGGYSMDYANPEYQKFAADAAAEYLKDCGIAGWRVDCARQSPDNERPTGGRIPSQSGTEGALKMMHQVSGEIKKVDPEAILLGETHTTVNLSEMEFIYDTRMGGAYFTKLLNQKPSQFVPKLKKYFARDNAAFPIEYASGLMRYSENHDMPPAIRRYGSGQRNSLLGLTFLIPGLPLVNMEHERGAELLIRKLSQIRKRPEFISGEPLYEETKTWNTSVFAFTRYLEKQFSVVAINFCGQTLPLTLTLPEKCEKYQGKFRELVNNTKVRKDGRKLSLIIQPYQTCVIAFAPEMPKELDAPAMERKPLTSKVGKETLENRFWKISFENGFPVSVRNHDGREIVPEWHWVADHFQLRWKEIDKNLGKSLTVTDCRREKKNGAETLTFSGKWKNGKPFQAVYTLKGLDFSVDIKGIDASEGALEVSFGSDVSEWFASALEGSLHGYYFPWHVSGDEFTLFERKKRDYPHMLQMSGVIYESSAQPLHPRTGQIALKKGNFWTGIRFSTEDQKKADNIVLREKGEIGDGLTMRLASKSGEYAFTLRSGNRPILSYGWLKKDNHVLISDGPRHTFRTGYYEIVLNRNQGGNTDGIFVGGKPMILSSRIFSDDGFFFPRVNNEFGKIHHTIGGTSGDLEAGMRIEESDSNVKLEFLSRLKKDDQHHTPALPQTDCRIVWQPDDTARIRFRTEVDAKALLPYQLKARGAEPENLNGTLRQEFQLSGLTTDVKIRTQDKIQSVPLKKAGDGVLFSTTDLPDELTFYGADGKLTFRMVNFRKDKDAAIEFVKKKENTYLQIVLLKTSGRREQQKAEFSCDFLLKLDRHPESDELVRLCVKSRLTPAAFCAKKITQPYYVRRREAVNGLSLTQTEALTELRRLKKDVMAGNEWKTPILKTAIPFLSNAPAINGKINSDEWKDALVFKEEFPLDSEKALPKSNAVWYLGYDRKYIYFAAKISGSLMKPGPAGKPFYGDSIEIFLHPDKRLADYLETVVSFRGECYQAYAFQSLNQPFDVSVIRKPSAETSVTVNGSTYCVEGRIPFSSLPGYLLGNEPKPGASMNFMLICCRVDRFGKYIRTTPYPFLYDGHNIFGYIQGTLADPAGK